MRTIGIDLGTTISLVGVQHEDGRVSVVSTRDGGSRLRSVVHIASNGAATVGEAAQRLAPLDPDAVFAFFKRSMGTDWKITSGGRDWTPQDLSAKVLDALVEDATAELGYRPARAVVTIPAYFGDDARRATLQAADTAGLEVLALLHEPTAACIASRNLIGGDGTILVYDLGGGTFDVSVVAFHPDHTEVLATAGDHRLGGKDWDDLIVDLVAERLSGELDDDPRDDIVLLAELQERAREAKHTLSRLERTAVTLHVNGRVHRVEVDRAEFWARGQALVDRTAELIARVLGDIGGAARLDGVLLAGGSTRMPPCAELLRTVTGRSPLAGIDADEAIVRGAAIFATAAPGHGLPPGPAVTRGGLAATISDITAHALGFVVVAADGSRYVNEIMIARNTPLPANATKTHQLQLGRAPHERVLSVYMLQGEAERPLDTDPLGAWRFTDIPGETYGPAAVTVSYSYNADGVVEVTASIDEHALQPPEIDREDRDVAWTEEEPSRTAGDLAAALVIDVSGSMSGTKLQEAKDACVGFIDELEEVGIPDRVALVSFGSHARTILNFGASPENARQVVRALRIEGSTNLDAGLQNAEHVLTSRSGRRVLVVLTDGEPDDRHAALTVRHRLVGEGIELIARGVAGANQGFLEQLATRGGELVGEGELGRNFRGIARQLVSVGGIRRA
jgi:molecular chaperone DnaK (HSP70)